MNYTLNDDPIDYSLSGDLTFKLSDENVNFNLNAVSPTGSPIPPSAWVLTTGIWNDTEFWDDNAIWRDA